MRTEYVRCARCDELKATDHECYQKRLKRYGSVVKMEAEWQCSKCRQAKQEAPDIMSLPFSQLTQAERQERLRRLQREVNKIRKQSIPYYEDKKSK